MHSTTAYSHRASLLAAMARKIDLACQGEADKLPQAVARILCEHGSDAVLLTPEQCKGSDQCYTRHLLYADPAGRYTVVAIVWSPGQQTPVHAHYTWCAYRVFSGSLEEDRYQWDAGHACAHHGATVARVAGQTGFGHAGMDQIHRLRNTSAHPAISIHVYGVDAARVSTHVNRLAPEAHESQREPALA